MAYRPMSRSDPFDPAGPSHTPVSLGESEASELGDDLSLAALATALSAHGGGALSADLALDLVLNEIVEHARLATGATAAAIALARGDEIVCRATTGANAPDLGVKLDVHSGLSGACVQSKNWQRCDDTEADSRVDAEICRSLGVRSILVFPVVKGDELLGVFEIFSPRPNAFSDREIQTLEALSRSIVKNVDRAVDVLSPPAPVFPSSTTAAAISAHVGKAENLDHFEVDPLPVDGLAVDSVQADPATIDHARFEATQLVPAPLVASLPVADSLPEPAADFLPETTTPARIPRRDPWMTILTMAVIALALFLGWMMGYVRSPRSSAGVKGKAVTNAAAPSAPARPLEGNASSTGTAARAPNQTTPAGPAKAPVASQLSGVQPTGSQVSEVAAPPTGGLVVYENGKVIFRTSPPTSGHSGKDAGRLVMVPSKVADEYLVQRVEPEYPEAAREQHIQGPVVLDALVGEDGAVEKLTTISGDSQLAAAATDAVRQWRFKPFFQNGSPEEFHTQITVSFRLP
jgi:TonB family protein